MTDHNDKQSTSAVERNLKGIGLRRSRLRIGDEQLAAKETPPPAPATGMPTMAAAPLDLDTASARMTARVAGVIDAFGATIVDDIAKTAGRTAFLRTFSEHTPDRSPPSGHPSRVRPDVVDVEAVEVEPPKAT